MSCTRNGFTTCRFDVGWGLCRGGVLKTMILDSSEMQLSHVLPCLAMSCHVLPCLALCLSWSGPQTLSELLRTEQYVTPLLEELEELRAELERVGLKRWLDSCTMLNFFGELWLFGSFVRSCLVASCGLSAGDDVVGMS